ncbi:hypothetical protein JF546_02710 [Nitratireductor aquimarinus]|uniref:hypothetical protein n=1 Tax=Nitratireductor aquimarinus TaxID=889300 RepID=UPI001A8C5D35|nr:hypothetical protein [Nitratireductor aquimarinus]MBN8241920.1 hypothetical protein [Nitratireductor aquimarinus]MBY6130306.1 hypothetical protein [Nitratireductor aquimarinus]MCA1305065.1 hypothetical protein [Nitratireductor aquimarinus]
MSEDLIERLRARGKVKDFQPGLLVCIEAAAEIERLRAKLASAKEVIAPFSDRLQQLPWVLLQRGLSAPVSIAALRAAAEWMEKGDE